MVTMRLSHSGHGHWFIPKMHDLIEEVYTEHRSETACSLSDVMKAQAYYFVNVFNRVGVHPSSLGIWWFLFLYGVGRRPIRLTTPVKKQWPCVHRVSVL